MESGNGDHLRPASVSIGRSGQRPRRSGGKLARGQPDCFRIADRPDIIYNRSHSRELIGGSTFPITRLLRTEQNVIRTENSRGGQKS